MTSTIPCPFCGVPIVIDDGECSVAHAMPPCEVFNNSDLDSLGFIKLARQKAEHNALQSQN